jgi:amino acid permease
MDTNKEQDRPTGNQDGYTADLEKLDSDSSISKSFRQQEEKNDGVKRRLSTRHIQMIAIGGTIG